MRIALAKTAEDRGQEVETRRGAGADPEPTALGGSVCPNHLGDAFQTAQKLFGFTGQGSSRIRQVKRFADLLEQGQTEFSFKLVDLPRHGRLGKQQLLGPTRVIEVFLYGQEGLQMNRVHG